jgi:hypothetical protein
MIKWQVQIYQPSDRSVPSSEFVGDFSDAKKAAKARRRGQTIRFVAPVNAPLGQIAELKALGALETF